MSNPYPEIDVSAWESVGSEQTGRAPKEWLFEPGSQVKWLFKQPKLSSSGDDWAEKVCCELYALVGVPHAQVELALFHGRKGVVSRDVRPPHSELIHGNAFLSRPSRTSSARVREFCTVETVLAALKDVEPPVGGNASAQSAAGVFVGYMMMDALTCAPDRNLTNWGVSRPRASAAGKPATVFLAASFDHGSSLGWKLLDESRDDGMAGRKSRFSPTSYATRAEGVFSRAEGDVTPMGTLEAFDVARGLLPESAEHWLGLLRSVALDDILRTVRRVPERRMSKSAAAYAEELLKFTYVRLVGNIG